MRDLLTGQRAERVGGQVQIPALLGSNSESLDK